MTCGRADGSFAQFMYFHQCQTWASQTGLAKKDLGPGPSIATVDSLFANSVPFIKMNRLSPHYVLQGFGNPQFILYMGPRMASCHTLSLKHLLYGSCQLHLQRIFRNTLTLGCSVQPLGRCILKRSLCGVLDAEMLPNSYGFGNQLPNS